MKDRAATAPEDTERALSEVDALSDSELAEAWRARFASDMPAAVPPRLGKLILAHAVQAGRRRPLPKVRQGLARSLGRAGGSVHQRPGAILVRDWAGETHEVEALAQGRFRWRGQEWRSLSAIARAMTGIQRNGPAFFGLRGKEGSP